MLTSAIAGGFLGTLVFSTLVRAASEMALTRMDLALLLGTAVTDNRRKARAIGYLLHLLLGIVFALAYAGFFRILGRDTWWLGAVAGTVHAVFTGTVLVNVLLPIVHPRMATTETAANETTLIEPPGFLMLNYGRSTFLVSLAAHIAYGITVALIVRL
jgi:uncharacterized membrane protein YagU involved in acid resistance